MTKKVARPPTSRMKNSRRAKRQAPSASEPARPTATAAPGEAKPSRTQKTISGARPRLTMRKVFTAFSAGRSGDIARAMFTTVNYAIM